MTTRERLRITVRGAVQGVGFRPFVHRLAREMDVGGWVRNDGPGVVLEAEGHDVAGFVARLRAEPPTGARIDAIDTRPLPTRGDAVLEIVASADRAATPSIVPDRVICDACLADVADPASRYHGYAFTSCAACGPRWSIVDRLPYDREHTAMAGFAMCASCRAEFGDPRDRRFHAQTIACPDCGPALDATSPDGTPRARGDAALDAAVTCLADGGIVALKGLGGFQLLTDATSERAIERLRARKHRPHEPFAVLVADVDAARAVAELSDDEAALLRSPAGPIVLVPSRGRGLARGVHPHHTDVGVLLPTTALHALLAWRVGRPLVCTSGNLHGEPMCTDDGEAVERLGAIADLIVGHDRPIRRAVDDSVARVVRGAPRQPVANVVPHPAALDGSVPDLDESTASPAPRRLDPNRTSTTGHERTFTTDCQVLRLARGYAPLVLPGHDGPPALAMGAQWKAALAVRAAGRIVVGPHVGDLDDVRTLDAWRAQADALCAFFDVAPEQVACDLHPDYASTIDAERRGLPVTGVQHHVAHALAVLTEHGRRGPALAVVWDGAGLGTDGTTWGGECLRVERRADGPVWERVGHLRPFRLPGGDAAARLPRRALAGLLAELPDARDRIDASDRALLDAGVAAPVCTSAGRLFDGVAALLGHDDEQTYEGMAPSLLERDATRATEHIALEPVTPRPGKLLVLDWTPTLRSLLAAHDAGAPRTALAAAFHDALADAIAAAARALGDDTVLLTGGCFGNRLLTERTADRLARAGHDVLLSRRLPPNDGGLAVGQLAALGASPPRSKI